MDINSYVTGFVDGEGSFLVSFTLRKRMKTGIEVRPSFTISQNKRDYQILLRIKTFFGIGGIRFNRRDDCYKYEVRSLKDLNKIVIPHFRRYPPQTSKRDSFIRFTQICKLIQNNQHLTKGGITTIINLAYQMNNLGARRYSKDFLLKIVNKMKV